jgi:MFS family permease
MRSIFCLMISSVRLVFIMPLYSIPPKSETSLRRGTIRGAVVRNAMTHIFRALESRNFRLFVSGQLISLIGTWMQQMAMSWLVYRLTGSAFLLGLVAFLGQGPSFFIAPFAGLLADRLNRRKILVMTQTLAMIHAFVLAYLALSGQVQVWHIMALSVLSGLVSGLDTPVRQAFVMDMLEKPEDLSNAISLNSSVFNASRLIGPSIAGLAIATVGEGWCFFLNGFSYIAVITALLCMRLQKREVVPRHQSYVQALREGFSYVYRFSSMRDILLLVALVSLVGLPYSTLMPIYARDILPHGPFNNGAQTLGFLMGAAGAGALTGAIFLASHRNPMALDRYIPFAAGLFGLSLMGFAFSHTIWLSLGLIYFAGLGMMVQLASSNIILQTLADNPMRGRVMSLYAMCCLGMTPFGSLLVGSLAHRIGVPITLLGGGFLCLLGAVCFGLRLSRLREKVQQEWISTQSLRLQKEKAGLCGHSLI